MKTRLVLAAALLVALAPAALLACSSCPPGEHVVNAGVFGFDTTCVDDVSASSLAPSPCSMACSSMRDLGCIEGRDARCVVTCEHVVDAGLTWLNTTCILEARDVAAMHRCGVACGGVP